MAQKKITDLSLIDEVTDSLSIPSDDGIQSYRHTAAQMKEYILADNSIESQMVSTEVITGRTADSTPDVENDYLLSYDASAALFKKILMSAMRKAPTWTVLTSTGSTVGYVFTITSGNATAGATYTNNSNTYTVIATIAAQTVLWCTQSAAPQASGTLTKASGTGDATLTFSAAQTIAQYTAPTGPAPIALEIEMAGGGGGGGGGGQTAAGTPGSAGTAGKATRFGSSVLAFCNGGSGGAGGATSSAGTAGGSASTGTATGLAQTGGRGGGPGTSNSATVFSASGYGGVNKFGGTGNGCLSTQAGGAGAANTGAGGGAGGAASTNQCSGGSGGGAGGYANFIIPSPAATYYYCVGTGGALGGAGTNGANGAAGGDGVIVIKAIFA